MGTVYYSFYAEENSLLVDTVETGVEFDAIDIDKNGKVSMYAETKNWGGWVEDELVELSVIALSGKLIVIKQSDTGAIAYPPRRFTITPGRVTVAVAQISWGEEKEDDLTI